MVSVLDSESGGSRFEPWYLVVVVFYPLWWAGTTTNVSWVPSGPPTGPPIVQPAPPPSLAVRISVHWKSCLVSWSCLLQSGHVGVGWFIESSLCSSGDLFAHSCTRVRLCLRANVFSESCIFSAAGVFKSGFTGLSRRYCLTVTAWLVSMLRPLCYRDFKHVWIRLLPDGDTGK